MYEPAKSEPTTPILGYGGLQQPSRAGKVPKPIMEKRRRARINKCLEELKVLIPDLTESGTRVDKADVLEMTVDHLTKMRNKRRNLTSNLSPHVTPYVDPHSQFKHGYQQCMAEVTKLLVTSNVDESVTSKLVEHLSSRSPAPQSSGNLVMTHQNLSPATTASPVNGMSPANTLSPVHRMSPALRPNSAPLVVPEPVRTSKLPQFAFTPMHYAQQMPAFLRLQTPLLIPTLLSLISTSTRRQNAPPHADDRQDPPALEPALHRQKTSETCRSCLETLVLK